MKQLSLWLKHLKFFKILPKTATAKIDTKYIDDATKAFPLNTVCAKCPKTAIFAPQGINGVKNILILLWSLLSIVLVAESPATVQPQETSIGTNDLPLKPN